MLFALGAASSAIDALKALMSSKSSSTQPGGPGQGATGPFDFSAATSAPTSAARMPDLAAVSVRRFRRIR